MFQTAPSLVIDAKRLNCKAGLLPRFSRRVRTTSLIPAAAGANQQWGAEQSTSYATAQTGGEGRIGTSEWVPALANAASLIGNLGAPIEVRAAGSGRVANFSLAVKMSKTKTTWFNVEAWGELAENAALELKKGEMVQVTGKILMDEWEKEGVVQRRAKVRAGTLARVVFPSQAPAEPQAQGWDSGNYSQIQDDNSDFVDQTAGLDGWGSQAAPNMQNATLEQKWDHVVKNYSEYYDNRVSKRNPKSPDFKHKRTGDALWMNTAPSWVLSQLPTAPAPQGSFR